jgi:hypothetical protein
MGCGSSVSQLENVTAPKKTIEPVAVNESDQQKDSVKNENKSQILSTPEQKKEEDRVNTSSTE